MSNVPALLEVADLRTHFTSFGGARVVKAVDGISFTLNEGETLGLIGESGCGKTTTCLSIVGLLPAGARIAGGSINFLGEDLTKKKQREMRRIRGRSIAMILQDPMASLNPLFSVYLAGRRTRLPPPEHPRPFVARARARSCCARCASRRRRCACATIRTR